jgi:hypothetical protein
VHQEIRKGEMEVKGKTIEKINELMRKTNGK